MTDTRCHTKLKILAEANKLFAKQGYAFTSLDDIAAKVSIAKPSLFYHFKNKEHIYANVVKESLSTIIADLEHYLKESRSGNITLEEIIIKVINKRLNDETVVRLTDMKTIGLDQKTFKEIAESLKKMRGLARQILDCNNIPDADLAAEVLINSINCYVLHANGNLCTVAPGKYGAYLASLLCSRTTINKQRI